MNVLVSCDYQNGSAAGVGKSLAMCFGAIVALSKVLKSVSGVTSLSFHQDRLLPETLTFLFNKALAFLRDSRSKAVCDEEWVTIVLAQVLFLHILDLLAWYIMNGLKLQTGRPPSCDIWKSLFKILFASYILLFSHFLHCIADARFL